MFYTFDFVESKIKENTYICTFSVNCRQGIEVIVGESRGGVKIICHDR